MVNIHKHTLQQPPPYTLAITDHILIICIKVFKALVDGDKYVFGTASDSIPMHKS